MQPPTKHTTTAAVADESLALLGDADDDGVLLDSAVVCTGN